MAKNNKDRIGAKKLVFSIILALVIFVAGGLGGFFLNRLTKSNASNTIEELMKIIEDVGYVYDEQTFEKKSLTTKELANSLLLALDDYATYYTPEEYSALLKKREGRYNNYGFGFYGTDLQIDVCYYNSPAFNAGIRRGDKIISGRLSLEQDKQNFNDVYDFLEYFSVGNTDKTIHLTVERTGEILEREFSFSLSQFEAVYVSYKDSDGAVYFRENNGERTSYEDQSEAINLPKDTAYIDFISFEGKAAKQLKDAVKIMKERGKTRLILDLRDNGGGQMSVLQEVASTLIYNDGKSNFPIVYEEHKNKTDIIYSAKNQNNDFIEKIIVLANGYSASASECLIGAMNYYCKSVFSLDDLIVEKNGDSVAKTYGKGIMQTTYTLLSGGAFMLTTAKIAWPDKSTCIHGIGIRPTNPLNAVEKDSALSRAIEYLS